MRNEKIFDVCIGGAGLAGLGLARQLKLEMPNLSIVLLEKQNRPLQKGTHKVGESLIEVGANYLINTLQLKNYLDKNHHHKNALRFFTGDNQKPIEYRTEFGTMDFPLIPAVQIDRGVYEEDLRKMCISQGITIIEGVSVSNVTINEGDTHIIEYESKERKTIKVKANWFVDAMGRRRFIAKKMNIKKDVGHKASACWWRLPGKWDISEAVTNNNSKALKDWKEKEISQRWYATNHFLGNGYWIWFIPVANHTSVGIVSDESIHPIKERATSEKAMNWLSENEPYLAKWINKIEPSDFLLLKNFSYTSEYFYSSNRWAMIGEAAMFGDPYYSTGSDLIALQNNIVTRLIKKDLKNKLSKKEIEKYNILVKEFFRGAIALYEKQYIVFGNEYIHCQKVGWDYDYLLGAMGNLGFSPHVLDDVAHLDGLITMMRTWANLNEIVQKLLRDWAILSPGKKIDRSENSIVGDRGMLSPGAVLFQNFCDQLRMRDGEKLIEACMGPLLEYVEGRALWLFKKAINDIKTEDAKIQDLINKIRVANNLNPYAINLDFTSWEENNLFLNNSEYILSEEQMEYMVPAPVERERMIKEQLLPHEMIWSNIMKNPHECACDIYGVEYKYSDLGKRAGAVWDYCLSKGGMKKGTVLLTGKKDFNMVATILGILSAGMNYVYIPTNQLTQDIIDLVNPSLLIVDNKLNVDLNSVAAVDTYSKITGGDLEIYPLFPKATLNNRLRPYYSKVVDIEKGEIDTITGYSMTNLCLYEELALREYIALNNDVSYDKLIICSLETADHDWLLPLMNGGVLLVCDENMEWSTLTNYIGSKSKKYDGQGVISGNPENLLNLIKNKKVKRSDLSLLSINRALTGDETTHLSSVCKAVINAGYISWGYEDFWSEEFKKIIENEAMMELIK